MRFFLLAAVLSSSAFAVSAAAADSVLLAGRRGGWIETIDPSSLETVSRLRVPDMADSIASDPSGQRLFVTAPVSVGKGCCALFALDPRTLALTFLVEPAQSATVTANRVFTQRGAVGIEVFDSQELGRLPTINAPGNYRLRASPDGRRLFGITNWPHPSIDLFDTGRAEPVARQPLAAGSSLAGTWLDRQYFLLTVQSGRAAVQRVNADSGEIGEAVSLPSSGIFPNCPIAPYDMVASGDSLAIYGQFGLTSDGRCAMAGGFIFADPRNGTATRPLLTECRFRQIVASTDGRFLYGLEVGSPAWQRVRILKIDARSAEVLAEKSLDSDVWFLTMGTI
jgi:hypothetical protein